MCYSAQVESAYAAYIRATGAEIDITQFEEYFGLRLEDPSIRIPRAVDRWFERPTGAGELKLRNLVMQHRAARIQEIDADLAKQRERLSGAEVKLATKPTKSAANDKRIATDKIAAFEKRLPLYTGWEPTRLDDRIFPMQYAPIVMMQEGKAVIRLARYHCRQNGKPASIDKERDGLYNARRDNLSRFWRHEFAHTHAVLLVNTFWENVDRQGKNHVLHFTPEPRELMHIACLYSIWKDPAGGPTMLSFAAVTDEPPPEIAAAGHDRCIVNLKQENVRAWLTPEGRSVDELQTLLNDKQRPYYEHREAA